jgi:hypothetical protein
MAELARIKKVWTANIKGATPHLMVSDGMFAPSKITITDYGTRAKVELSGPKISGMTQMRTRAYKLYGYAQYETPPEWVIELVSAIGYWSIESGSMS